MQKIIAAVFCIACLAGVSDARAQSSADQTGPPAGYGNAPGAYGGQGYSGQGASGNQSSYGNQNPYGNQGNNPGMPPYRPDSGIMGILPQAKPNMAGPKATPNPDDVIGIPNTPGEAITVCMNRNPPDGTVITRSVRQARCGDRCESEIQVPAGERMLICRGQAIPKGYTLELLTTTPACSCYGREQNAYMIRAESENEKFQQALPQ
jgi:hypothetical protein